MFKSSKTYWLWWKKFTLSTVWLPIVTLSKTRPYIRPSSIPHNNSGSSSTLEVEWSTPVVRDFNKAPVISVIFTKKIQRKALVEGIPSQRPSFLGFGCPALCLNGHASLSLCSQPIRAQYLLGSRPMSVAPLCLAGAAMLMFWKVRPYKSPGPLFLSSGLLQGGTVSANSKLNITME